MSTSFAVLVGIVVNCIWGLAFLVPHLMQEVDPVLLTLGRYLCYGAISAILLLSAAGRGVRAMTAQDWRMALLLAFTGNVGYYALVVTAIQLGGVPIAALVIGTLPVTIAIIGNIAQREFPFRVLAPAMVLILAGLLVLNGHKLATTPDDLAATRTALGLVAAVGALALWTWYGVRNAQYMKRNPHVDAHGWSVAIGLATAVLCVGALPLLVLADGVIPAVDVGVLADRDVLLKFVAGSLLLGVVVSWFAEVKSG